MMELSDHMARRVKAELEAQRDKRVGEIVADLRGLFEELDRLNIRVVDRDDVDLVFINIINYIPNKRLVTLAFREV